MSTYVLPACMFVHYVPAWFQRKSEESIRSPKTGIIIMSHHMGAGNQTWTCARIASTLNYLAISPALSIFNIFISQGFYFGLCGLFPLAFWGWCGWDLAK